MTSEPLLTIADEAIFRHFDRHLTDVETAILLGAIADKTYEQIAEASGYSISYVKRDVGPKLWRFLSEALGEDISKKNFRAALERYADNREADVVADRVAVRKGELLTITLSANSQVPVIEAQIDWGEAADVSVFYGRTEELKTMRQWVMPLQGDSRMNQAFPCRLLAILGMGGIGKSALSVKLAQQLVESGTVVKTAYPAFEYVIWRSLRNAPPLETLLADLVPFLSNQQDTVAERGRLLQHLRDRRCLVILDNLETILDTERPGLFRAGYENYGDLLRLIGEINLQSCVILTSREKPAIMAALEGEDAPVRSLRLQGSPEIAQALVHAKKLKGNDTQKQMLCDRYSNSPLALKIIATTIRDLFGGDIAAFLAEDTIIFNGIRRLLDSQFERLSALEQAVMYWLAINREWTSISELQEDILPPVPKTRILEALEALSGRSLIEQQINRYTQQPVVMEYVTDRLTTGIADELRTSELSLFLYYALIKTTVKDYIRDSQMQLIVGAIADQFCKQFSSATAIAAHIDKILSSLRRSPTLQSSYAAGNLLNLCQQAQIDLTGCDFSRLTIRHAYLRKTSLHRVNFSHANLIATVFTQPFGNVLSIDFSPNGEWLATGDVSGQVRLWQVSDGQPYRTWEGHSFWTKAVRFSPDGTRLASGSYDFLVKLWDIQTGQCLRELSGHQNVVMALAWSLDGRVLISVDWCTVKLWEVATGQCLAELDTGAQAMIAHIAHHPTEDMFALCLDGQIQLWTLRDRRCIRTLVGHTALAFYAAWHPDGRRLATASHDQTVKVWDTQTGECLVTLQGNDQMWTVLWMPDRRTLASTSSEGLLQLWDTETGKCLRVIRAHNSTIWALISHPTRPFVATGSEEQNVKFWSTETWDCLGTLQGYDNGILTLALSPDGQTLAVGAQDQTVRFWDLKTRTCTKIWRDRTNCTWQVDWHPQGQKLAVGALDGSFHIWDVATNNCLKVRHGALGVVHTLAWHPDGIHLAMTTTSDFSLRIWNVDTQKCLQILQGSLSLINCLVWSPDGRFLATGGFDNTVRVWDVQTGRCLHTLQDHFNTIPWITWSPDGQQLASASRDQTMRVWDATTGQCLRVVQGQTCFWTVEWSTDGKRLVSASQDGKIQIWDVSTGECLKVLQGHTAGIRRVLWAEQDSVLISGGADGLIELWDAKTGQCLQTLQADRPYEGMNISGVTGITEAQKNSLIALGATIEQSIENRVEQSLANTLRPAETAVANTQSDISDRADRYPEIYVERSPIESICHETLLQPGSLVRVKALNLMGKTSLINRVLSQIEREGHQVVSLSFELADKSVHFKDINKFMRWFCAIISRELGIANKVDDYWDEEQLGAKISCIMYFEEYLLPQANAPLVLGLDDVDLLFSFPEISEDFFSLLRSWHEKAKSRSIWKQLRLLLAHPTEMYSRLDINQSPFNIGVSIELTEFTAQQVQSFAQQFGVDYRIAAIAPLLDMVGGHPYLLKQAFTYLKNHPQASLEQLLAAAPTEAGIYHPHLRDYCLTLQKHPKLMNAFRAIVSSPTPVPIDPNTSYQLQCMGLVKFVGNQVTARCNLYQQYFAGRL